MKIAFVAHEFGIFPSHGGIASYLLQIVKELLQSQAEVQIDVVTTAHGGDEFLLNQYPDRFRVHQLNPRNTVRGHLEECRNLLADIQPDVVESSEYMGLIKLAVLDKCCGLGFEKTTFVTKHHTATREIFEWGTDLPVSKGPAWANLNLVNERDQMRLSDANIAPSHFLAKYAVNRYELDRAMEIFPYPYSVDLKPRASASESSKFDFSTHGCRFAIVLLTRFEPRKNQLRLVREFCQFLSSLENRGDSLEGIELHMAGNSVTMELGGEDYRQYVFDSIDPHYLDHVHFWDFLRLDQQDHLIQLADLAVMPSTFENFPVAMIETVLRNIAVMGSRYSGVADYSTTHSELLTFDPLAEGHLAGNILAYFDSTLAQRQDVLANQKRELLDLLSPQNTVQRKLEYFTELAHATTGKRLALHGDNTFTIVPDDFAATGHQLMASHTCGEFVQQLLSNHATYCNLIVQSQAEPSPRLQQVLTSSLAPQLQDKAVAFCTDLAFQDVLQVFEVGGELLIPCIDLRALMNAPAGQTLFEFAVEHARSRQVILDFSQATEPRKSSKQFTDYCFASQNRVIESLVSYVA